VCWKIKTSFFNYKFLQKCFLQKLISTTRSSSTIFEVTPVHFTLDCTFRSHLAVMCARTKRGCGRMCVRGVRARCEGAASGPSPGLSSNPKKRPKTKNRPQEGSVGGNTVKGGYVRWPKRDTLIVPGMMVLGMQTRRKRCVGCIKCEVCRLHQVFRSGALLILSVYRSEQSKVTRTCDAGIHFTSTIHFVRLALAR